VPLSLFCVALTGFEPLTASGQTKSNNWQLSCDARTVFSETVLRDAPMLLETSEDEIDRAVVKNLRAAGDNKTGFGELLAVPVRVLGTTSGFRSYLVGEIGASVRIFSADILTGMVSAISYGCKLRTAIDQRRSMEIWRVPGSPKLKASMQRLQLLVQDESCGGGGLTVAPRIVSAFRVTPKTIEVAITLKPLELPASEPGTIVAATCEGYGPTPITITLPVKLGQRKIVNGGTYPSSPLETYRGAY
jgi:hypothetical protein